MKALLFIPICLASLVAAAQTDEQPKHRDVLALGLQLGAQQSYENRGWNGHLGKLFSVSNGVFARCYATSHLAIETGLHYSRSETGFTQPTYVPPHPDISPYSRKVWSYGVEVPLQVQWHFFGSDTRFRPYVGAGLAYVNRHYSFTEDYIVLASREVLHGPEFNDQMQTIFLQFSQGCSYRINRHLIATENLQVQTSEGNTTDFGLRLGVGFVL